MGGEILSAALVLLAAVSIPSEKLLLLCFPMALIRRVILTRPISLSQSLSLSASFQCCPISVREAAEPGLLLQELWETPSQKEEELQPLVKENRHVVASP